MKIGIAAAVAVLLSTSAADAASVLYRNDYNLGTDHMAQALADSGHDVTALAASLDGVALGKYDLVVYANQNYSVPSADLTALNGYLSGGGRVIFSTWTKQAPALNSAYGVGENQSVLTVGGAFGAGIAGPITLDSQEWGVFSLDLAATAGGTVAGTWGNGAAAIVIGNGGRSIHNGFLTDTLGSSQLYSNQIGALLGSAVPEPATWALMILGFGAVGGALRRRQSARATVRFA